MGEREQDHLSVDWRHMPLEQAVNWNDIQDQVDLDVWNKLTANFWLPEKIAVSNDVASWATLTPEEKTATNRVFAGLTLLDSIQGKVGATSLMPDARTQHEVQVYANITFMECLTKDHDVLTPHGWIPVTEIGQDDLIAQYDHERGISFVHPTHVSHHYAEMTYLIESQDGRVQQHVSPGHRVLLEQYDNNSGTWQPHVVRAEELSSDDLHDSTRILCADPVTRGNDTELSPHERISIAMNALTDHDGVARTARLIELTTLTELLDHEEIPYHLYYNNDLAEVVLDYTDRVRYDANTLQSFVLLNEDSSRVRSLFHEIWDWNAHGEPHSITLNNTADVQFVYALAALSGYSVTVADNQHCTMTVHDSPVVSGSDVTFSQLNGAEVYGIEVPSSFLVTKNGASVSITGNCVHAKSYSSIFSTLLSSEDTDEAFRWSRENEYLCKKQGIILHYYHGDDPEKRKIASTLLESFLFYTGFFMPLWWASKGKLVNTADIIRLIIRDEAVHGYYIGYKFQLAYRESSPERQQELRQFADDLLHDLYQNELHYTESLYDDIGLTEHVKTFLKYNAVKAFQNLGLDEPFPPEETEILPQIQASLDPNSNDNHDFFSLGGTGYVVKTSEEPSEDEWEDMFG